MYESFKENRQIVYKGNTLTCLPYKFHRGNAVVYNNRLHILGGYNFESEGTRHYSWDGNSWRWESTLPYSFDSGSAVVYDGKIHILGGVDYRRNHYVWDGITSSGSSHWSSVSTLPMDFYGTALVYNNELHGLGFGTTQSADRYFYSFNGTTWESKPQIADTSAGEYAENVNWYSSCIIFNDSIYVMDKVRALRWNGTSWTSTSTNYNNDYDSNMTVYNGYLYYLGGYDSIVPSDIHYDGEGGCIIKRYLSGSLINYSHRAIPYSFHQGVSIVYNNNLYLLGGEKTPKILFNLSSSDKFF